jgi:hypothetical protein
MSFFRRIAPHRSVTRATLPCLLGTALIAFVFVVNIYRAAHQSITADEAFAYEWYGTHPLNWIFVVYSATNHVRRLMASRQPFYTRERHRIWLPG